MDIDNNNSVKSRIINRKTVPIYLILFFFFMLLAEKLPEIFPKRKRYFLFQNLSL